MAKRKRNWTWRQLAENGSAYRAQQAKPVEYRGDPSLRGVRHHVSHSTTPAIERFNAMLEEVAIGEDPCLVWRGGETFRVDEKTVTTPARFYREAMLGERLGPNEALYRTCKTPRCVKHKAKRQTL